MFFITDAYAMNTNAAGGGQGLMGQLFLFGIIFLVFFLLVIRPQQKKVKRHREMISSLKKGDQVLTSSGIYGKINKCYDDKDMIMLEIADKTVVKLQKAQISEIVKPSKALKEKTESTKPDEDK